LDNWKDQPPDERYRIRLPRPDRIPREDSGGAPPELEPPADWYRPRHRRQDPGTDPREPGSGESSDAGYDHGWSNCTMTSGANTLDFHTLGAVDVWGGDLRHAPGQPDQAGGTDLWDVEKAWRHYGQDLEIRSGAGWDGVRADRLEGRALILTGDGNVPGAATFDGAHAIAIYPEPDAAGRWLMADPLSTGPEWVTESSLRAWAEHLDPDVNYARTAAHPPVDPRAIVGDDEMYNVAPLTTHRDAIVRDGAILYRDSALIARYSVATGDTAFGFLGSTGEAHVIANAGSSNYVNRDDVLEIVANERTFE
jgi:hypothetical protein